MFPNENVYQLRTYHYWLNSFNSVRDMPLNKSSPKKMETININNLKKETSNKERAVWEK